MTLHDEVVDLVRALQRDAFAAQLGVDTKLAEADPPIAQRLREIDTPALVVVGADGLEDFHRIAERLATELPRARPVVTIAGAAHPPALERPDEVAALLRDFLA